MNSIQSVVQACLMQYLGHLYMEIIAFHLRFKFEYPVVICLGHPRASLSRSLTAEKVVEPPCGCLRVDILCLGLCSEEGEEQVHMVWTSEERQASPPELRDVVGARNSSMLFSTYETLAHSVLIFHYCSTSEMDRRRLYHVKTIQHC